MRLSLQQVCAVGGMWIATSSRRCPTDALAVLPRTRTRHYCCHRPIILRTQLLRPCSSSATSNRCTTTTAAAEEVHWLLSPLTTGAPIRARTIPIHQRGWNITIYEVDEPAAIVASYWEAFNNNDPAVVAVDDDYRKKISSTDATTTSYYSSNDNNKSSSSSSPRRPLDPFGLVAWPGAVIAARELHMHQHRVKNQTVLVLGAGCGVEALAAAQLGAKRVMATDLHPQTLELLSRAATSSSSDVITTQMFDITNHSIPLPNIDAIDLLIVADVLYNDDLAGHIARRINELLLVSSAARSDDDRRRDVHILVTDSQRFVVNATVFPVSKWGTWETRTLASFCGSGVAVDEDQIYDATVRVLWITTAGGGGGGGYDGGDHVAHDDIREDTPATTTPPTFN